MLNKSWAERKQAFYQRMLEDREIGYLDPGIEGLLEAFFRKDGVYTTSSCIGRITLIEGTRPWDREESTVVYKIHGRIDSGVVLKYLKDSSYKNLWLRVTGPIIHVNCRDLKWAQWIINLARKVGFKHSCIFSVGDDVVVEIMSSIQITLPLKINGAITVSLESLGTVVDKINSLWEMGVSTAENLREMIEADPGPT
jgi:tRNA wybutosine-synthesizing protein 3